MIINKKHYPLDLMELQNAYRTYLTRLNLSNLTIVAQRFSTVDAFIVSATTTTMPVEYKNRDSLSVAAYNSCMIDYCKYQSLVQAAKLLDTKALLIVEYSDVILIYTFDGTEDFKIEKMPVDGVLKDSLLIPYTKCSYVISKHTRQLRDVDHLLHYINKKRERAYNNLMLDDIG